MLSVLVRDDISSLYTMATPTQRSAINMKLEAMILKELSAGRGVGDVAKIVGAMKCKHLLRGDGASIKLMCADVVFELSPEHEATVDAPTAVHSFFLLLVERFGQQYSVFSHLDYECGICLVANNREALLLAIDATEQMLHVHHPNPFED